jgi:hypothetical protein
LISSVPISPAIRLAKEKSYLTVLLSTQNGELMTQTMGGLSETNEIWSKLDIVVRVRETLTTKNDPGQGCIAMGRPRIVTELSYTKRYT